MLSADQSTADAPRLRFPTWTAKEQGFWMDMLDSYSETLLGQLGNQRETGDTVTAHMPDEAQCVEAVQLAARLADEAVKEMGYRFWIQRPTKARTKRRTKR